LDPARYPLGLIAALRGEGTAGAYEVLLSDTLIRYVADRNGAGLATVRLPVDMRELGRPVDAAAIAARALMATDPVAALAVTGPQDAGYLALKHLLGDYRALAAAGGWPAVPDGGAKIEPGAYDSRIPAIRARLAVTDGAVPVTEHANRYDQALVAAVQRFQLRHGLKDDGVIGKLTLQHLGTSVESRIRQILVNMERRRQQLNDLGPNRIIVNIPEFTLRYYEEGELALVMPVVIGRTQRKTPLLESKVTNVVLNPPWSVPARNAGEDIVRKQINDPNYLQAHGYTVYFDGQPVDPSTIDWTQVPRSRSIPYRLRQAPGAGNSLGRLKINFKNDYAVYLHDTPDKHLFNRDMRALSSGCVRVKDPFELGARLLRDVPRWDRARMDSYVAGSTATIFVTVVHDIGVRLTYVTAWVDDAGTAQFRDDLYGIDRRIADGLSRPAILADAL
ncbi:MAG: L,D-transpeptidase family protein, partial [Novosphingobium sp.]|nr:L,D-transpeptidase family protein [Novosphingobium sp.]